MRIVDLIEKKKKGEALTEAEIKWFIDGIMDKSIADYQTSAFLMATYFKGMTLDETAWLTKYMVESGEILDLSDIGNNVVDKHSTGGVGDKITLMFLPIVSAAGVPIAKLSGRGLGHTGGTIDKLESIPGFRTDLSTDEFKSKIKEIGAAIAAQTANLAPADGILYALRDVTSTVDIIPMIASSVVSKKIASGANVVVLDVKYGSGAFMKTPEDAEELSRQMVEIGKRLGRNICAVISSMDEPLGRAVGNAYEIIEAIEFLKGNTCSDLEEITYGLAGVAFERLGVTESEEAGKAHLKEMITTGKAIEKFREIIKAQGGDERIIDDYSLLPQPAEKIEIRADQDGFVKRIDALKVAKGCKLLGAGREKKTDPIDYAVGVYLNKKTGEKVNKGDVIATVGVNDKKNLEQALDLIKSAFEFTDKELPHTSLIYKIVK